MPELPEVETIVRQLQGMIVGKAISGFESHWINLTEPEPASLFAARLTGRRIEAVRRRGKLVVMELDGGEALVISLRMTGRFVFREPGGAVTDRFIRGTINFTDGSGLCFSDIRKFGRMAIVDLAEISPDTGSLVQESGQPLYRSLGIEPLTRSFTVVWFGEFLKRRARSAIKPLLLDGRGIAGIGNIYAIEALWRAGIHPLRAAGSLRSAEVESLHEALRWSLRKGIRLGGASRRDYRDARGQEGRMQKEFQVYSRAGEPCPKCGSAIRRTVVGGRSTFHCARCQPAPRGRVARVAERIS